MSDPELARRVAELEVQVDWLRQLVDQLYRAGTVPPPGYRPFQRHPSPTGTGGPAWPPGPDDPIAVALAAGNKIGAIKLYRDRTGVGLKEAKDAIDALG